ncbi:hypothetical protein D9Q98_007489 [Chlorella vulgaris]|uniref:Vacuolar sorting protein 39/Transforming growth factor beta receptor-associated zinc finger domain-containing protein n=1 Tax=Chlorella vulgaris TaxID=3077 RepID=A0A9D4YVM6_CHLVU|nr:hypothetical protein D9Q98_007489 [Chlorella vulgaris]
MAIASSRTAFTAALLLDRRHAANTAAITAVAVDQAGCRLYLGLEDGVLEEHAILHSSAGVRASLAARKHAAKKAILSIQLLAAHGLVLLLSEDGAAQLLDAETLEGQHLPLRHAVAMCVAMPPGRPPRLAVATKPGRKSIRFVVYELVPPAAGTAGGTYSSARQLPHPQLLAQTEVPDASSAVNGMAWVGGQLAVCAGMRYLLVSPFGPPAGGNGNGSGGTAGSQWQELLAVPQDLAYSPAMLAAVPELGRAVLVVGPAGIVVDAAGSPVGSTVRLEGLGATPRALASSGPFLLVVSEAAIHVFSQDSGTEVQRLDFAPGLRPAPGQTLHAAPAGPASAAGGRGGNGEAGGGGRTGCVAVAGRRLVWLCMPVSAADQARELLGLREFEAAEELIERGLLQGAAWALVAAAQAALLLLHECRFEEAVRYLDRCPPSTFQPRQLFPLFPSYTAAWTGEHAGQHRQQQYWGLHSPLPSLESLISQHLASTTPQQQQQRFPQQQRSTGSRVQMSASEASRFGPPQGSSSGSSGLFGMDVDGSSGGAGSPAGSASPAAAAGRAQGEAGLQRDQHQVEPAAAAEQNEQQQPGSREEEHGGRRRQLQRQAWEGLVQYLFRARMIAGVQCLEGVDTLLLLLLADLGAARQVAAFAAVPNQVDAAAVEPRLAAEQWHHALATLHAARGEADLALRIWRQVADGQLASPAGPEVQAAEQREALDSAAALLRDPVACPEAALLSNLPWLLAVSQAAALGVLTARKLQPAAVLPLLPPASDVRWRYLAHLVAAEEAAGVPADPQLHTELALQLAAAILVADPLLRLPTPDSSATPRRRVTGVPGERSGTSTGGRPPSRPGSSSAGGTRPLSRVGSRSVVVGGGGGRRGSRSTAALVSGGGVEPAAGASAVDAMRLRLRAHLEASNAFDAAAVLGSLQGTGLHEELVVLHAQAGDHMSALRLLALTLHDVAAAEAYARCWLVPGDYRALLHLVLEPGPGLEPRWGDACYLIASLGDHLDPQEVLQALPPGMPLAAAAPVVAPMLRDRLHRRRQAALVKNLHRARLAAAAGLRCDAESRHVAVDEERACPYCHLRLGGKVFVVLQPGMGPAGSSPCAGASATAQHAPAPPSASAAAAAAAPVHGIAAGTASQQQQPPSPQQQRQQQGGEAEEGENLPPPGDDGLAVAARALQQQLADNQAPQVLCYACFRRLGGQQQPAPDALLAPA